MQITEILSHLFHPRRSNNHRPRLLHNDSYLSIIGLTFGFALFVLLSKAINPQMGFILGYASDISVTDVVAQTNQQRSAAGIGALTLNQTLSNAAAAKAQDMFAKQYWAHQSPEGKEPWAFISEAGYTYVAAGENLARDFMNTPDMVNAWMASPTHKANIMNPRYEEIGIAVVNGNLQGMDTTLVVQMFGRPTTEQAVPQISEQAPATTEVTPQETVALNLSESTPQPSATPLATPEPTPTPGVQPVLATSVLTASELEPSKAAFSPLQLSKSFALAILIVLVTTLVYDWYIAHTKGVVRMTGKNSAHIIYLIVVAFIIIVFKGGFIF